MAAAPTLFLFSASPFSPTPLASAPRTLPPLRDKRRRWPRRAPADVTPHHARPRARRTLASHVPRCDAATRPRTAPNAHGRPSASVPHQAMAAPPIKPPASQPRNPSRPSPLFLWAPPPPEARERGSRGEAEGKEGEEKKSAAQPLLSTKKRKEDPELLLYSEPSTRRSRSPPEQATPPSREGGPAPTPPGARRRRAGAHDRLRRRSGSTCTAPTRHGSASSLRRHPSVLEPNR